MHAQAAGKLAGGSDFLAGVNLGVGGDSQHVFGAEHIQALG